MSGFAHPLVALALTDADAGLLKYASLAASLGPTSDVRFAHVLPVGAHAGHEADVSAVRQRMEAEVRACFEALPESIAFDVVRGARIDELLELSLRHQRDLILVGHRGSHSGRRSLARRLAMVTPCSVWLAPDGAPCRITNILTPIDFSNHSADALATATAVAAAAGVDRVCALHVFFDPSTIRYDEHVEEIRGQEQAAFERMVSGIDCHGVAVEPLFEERTDVPHAILQAAERLGSDLIVMNTRGRSRAAAVFLGSVTSATMASTRVPLLAVKHFGSHLPLLSALLSQRIWRQPTPKTN